MLSSFAGARVGRTAQAAPRPSARRAVAVRAESADTIDVAVDALVSGVKTAGAAFKAAAPVFEEAIKEASPVVQKAAPVVQEGVKIGTQALSEAARLATPYVGSAANQISAAISSNIDTNNTAVKTGTLVATEATSVAGKIAAFLSTQPPEVLAEGAVAAVALWYLAPPLLGLFGGLFRGYRDDLTPPQALDFLLDGAYLIDLRSTREKEAAGVPDVPGSASSRLLELEFATTEDRKIRGLLRDPTAVETKITALQIAALKKVSRGTKLILMDAGNGVAPLVARELGLGKGFGSVYVLKGGFRSWVASKLETRSSRTVATPTVIEGNGTIIRPAKKIGTITKSLPAARG